MAAGLGTANSSFNRFERILETIRDVNKDSHNLGA
jgi:hypothetical protein